MTIEERLQKIIGQQIFAIAALETRLEQVEAQIAQLREEPNRPVVRGSGGNGQAAVVGG